MTIASAYETLQNARLGCNGCGDCVFRCEVLKDVGNLTVGNIVRYMVATTYDSNFQPLDLISPEQAACALQNVATFAYDNPAFVFAVRRCCLCAFCTASCPRLVKADQVFSAIRELFTLAGVVTSQGFESTQVDKEWHIFSVYRAVYGVAYPDIPHVGDLAIRKDDCEESCAENLADTLFFPGCPLVSYAPHITRAVYAKLGELGFNAVISEECCGSPLKTAGLADRAQAFRERIVHEALAAGIKRVVCVCPGCAEELRSVEVASQLEFLALPQILLDAGMLLDAEILANSQCSVFDSCNDRAGAFGKPLRMLLSNAKVKEMSCAGTQALCCGAGGAVSLVDQAICDRRVQRVFDMAPQGTEVIVTNCPTCSYTLAAYERAGAPAAKDRNISADAGCFVEDNSAELPKHINYLELSFGMSFNWEEVFANLESMWSGEYGEWVCYQLS